MCHNWLLFWLNDETWGPKLRHGKWLGIQQGNNSSLCLKQVHFSQNCVAAGLARERFTRGDRVLFSSAGLWEGFVLVHSLDGALNCWLT